MMKESEIQKAILDYLSYKKDVYFFRAGSGLIQTQQGRWFKTGKKGCPDIVCCKDGVFYGLEVKKDKSRLSEAQIQAKKDIEQAGGIYMVVKSIEDVAKII